MCLCLALLRSALSLRAVLTRATLEREGTVQNSSPSCVAIPVPCSGNFLSPQKCPSCTLAIITQNPSPPAPDNQEPTPCVCGSACSGRFPSVETSHHTLCVLLCLLLTERRVLRVHPHGSECQGFSPFHGSGMLPGVEGPLLLYF